MVTTFSRRLLFTASLTLALPLIGATFAQADELDDITKAGVL